MSQVERLVSKEEALSILEKHWSPRKRKKEVSLLEGFGKVVAENIRTPINLPPFHRAKYDGYAVRAKDTFGADEENPKELKLVEEIRAGRRSSKRVSAGECAKISTGALIPPGADAVVMVEDTRESGERVWVHRAVAPGENVVWKGSDERKGRILVRRGEKLGPRELGALAASGISRVKVFDAPLIGIISTGDELCQPGRPLPIGRVYDSNGYSISAAVMVAGGIPKYYGVVSDEADRIRKSTERALEECDMVVVSGGTSVGEGDVAVKAIASLGRPGVLVHGLTMKPGKPTFIAVIGKKPVFGLPGYPVSALMIFNEIVAPYIREMVGKKKESNSVRAELGKKFISVRGRRELVPVFLEKKENGWVAWPVAKDSGAIATLSKVDGYFTVPVHQELVEEGTGVEVRVFDR